MNKLFTPIILMVIYLSLASCYPFIDNAGFSLGYQGANALVAPGQGLPLMGQYLNDFYYNNLIRSMLSAGAYPRTFGFDQTENKPERYSFRLNKREADAVPLAASPTDPSAVPL